MDRKRVDYSSTSNSSESESAPPKKESKSKSKDSDKPSEKHRKKERHHEKKSKHHKRRSSRDDYEKSKRRYRDGDDDNYKSKRDKDKKDSKSDRRRSDDRRVKEKQSRKHDERKHKSRYRSKSPEKSSRRRSASSSSDRERKPQPKPFNNHLMKPSPIASTSSSPQKPPMISLATTLKLPPEQKIELPAYYNPNVINVNKFVEQQKKRKLLWSGKKEEPEKVAAKWGGAKFSQDTDGTKASKFMRLMGIKDAPKPEATAAVKPSDELFSTMEQQYEVARQVTHISRGVGLGFGSRPF